MALSSKREALDADLTHHLANMTDRIRNNVDLIYQEVCQRSSSPDINLSGNDYARERTMTIRRYLEECTVSGQAKDSVSIQEQNRIVQSLMSRERFDCEDSSGDKHIAAHLLGIHKPMKDEQTSLCLPQGMKSLVEPLLEKIGPKKIKYGAVVSKIDYSQFTVNNLRKKNDVKVLVTCKNGKVFEGHHVIMTASLGFLKQHA